MLFVSGDSAYREGIMEKRTRSPNYPALSLPEALKRVRLIYQAQHTHAAPREVVVKSMGYNGINGASATAISALHKYGLLDHQGDEVRISELAMRYLHPQDDVERAQALREAAGSPSLFRELAEKFPGRLPSEEVLRNYLIRNGFNPAAASSVILSYRDTIELVEREGGAYDSAQSAETGEPQMHPQPAATAPPAPPVVQGNVLTLKGNERSLGRYDLEGGGYVQLVAGGDVETPEALDWIEFLVQAKRREIERRAAQPRREVSTVEKPARGGELDDQ